MYDLLALLLLAGLGALVWRLGRQDHPAARFVEQDEPELDEGLLLTTEEIAKHIATLRRVLVTESGGWVLFRAGTCVLLRDPAAHDPVAWASDLLAEEGPVTPGTSSADFAVSPVDEHTLLVTYTHPALLNLFFRLERPGPGTESAEETVAGAIARACRHADARLLEVVHWEVRAA
jgi:hypothetical protein